jgi:hypothetical protein
MKFGIAASGIGGGTKNAGTIGRVALIQEPKIGMHVFLGNWRTGNCLLHASHRHTFTHFRLDTES